LRIPELLEMEQATKLKSGLAWHRCLPALNWLVDYRPAWLASDLVAGVTLAAYAIPVALAYATLAGLPPQIGIYGYLLGGLGYALLGTSRQLAVGPTSAISLMIAGTVGDMAGGDAAHYAAIASLAAFTIALLCLMSWLMRLSILVRLISDSILVGFKAGAGLTIIMTQLPSLLGVTGGGHNFFERAVLLVGELGNVQYLVLAIGLGAIAMLFAGERAFPGRPIALVVVVLAIIAATTFGLPALGIPITGKIPEGLPALGWPTLRLRDVDGIFPLAAGCLLLAYIEGVSAARSFTTKHGYELDSRQEFLGLGAANLAAALGHGYPVAGGLSQSAVNDKAGARTPLALVFASLTLAVALLFLTGFLQNLPKAVLAAIVFTAVFGLIDGRALSRMWRISKPDFYAATIALAAVLLLGILQGILLAAGASVLILLGMASQPHVAFLGRIPGTTTFSDLARHPENEQLPHIIVFRPEASLLYVNAEFVSQTVLERLTTIGKDGIRTVVCELSASPHIDLAGSRMLRVLHSELAASGIDLRIVGARGRVRDLLRADGLGEIVSTRVTTVDGVISGVA
jgi:SulP family sulfate permease